MKICKKCLEPKPLSEYRLNNGVEGVYRGECRSCEREYVRNWRKKNPEWEKVRKKRWREENPEKRKAHRLVAKALKDGVLVRPENCSDCGKTGVIIEGHHPDYRKPLEVDWLCQPCHRKAHLIEDRKKLDDKRFKNHTLF